MGRSKTLVEVLGDGLHNIFGAGFLAIASLVLVMASLISVVAVVLPFWFKLTLYNQVFGEEIKPNNITVDTGLYFMDKDKFINLLMIDKASSVKLMPSKLLTFTGPQSLAYGTNTVPETICATEVVIGHRSVKPIPFN